MGLTEGPIAPLWRAGRGWWKMEAKVVRGETDRVSPGEESNGIEPTCQGA